LKVAMIIKVAFSNQNWRGPCLRPFDDPRCFVCTRGYVKVGWEKPISTDERGYCKGGQGPYPFKRENTWCWEQHLCVDYCWPSINGNFRFAYKGMRAYFVYLELDGTLTLFAHSTVKEIHNRNGNPDDPSYLIFEPFDPLPEEKRIRGLKAEEILGSPWLQGRYRYLNEKQDEFLWKLLSGEETVEAPVNIPKIKTSLQKSFIPLNISLKGEILEQLERIASEEGREVEDLIREAVAKYVRSKESLNFSTEIKGMADGF